MHTETKPQYTLIGPEATQRMSMYLAMNSLYRSDYRHGEAAPPIQDLAFTVPNDALADSPLNRAGNLDLWVRSGIFSRILAYGQYHHRFMPEVQHRVIADLHGPVGKVMVLRSNQPLDHLFCDPRTVPNASLDLSGISIVTVELHPYRENVNPAKESIRIIGRHPNGLVISNAPYTKWNMLQEEIGFAITYAYSDAGLLSAQLPALPEPSGTI